MREVTNEDWFESNYKTRTKRRNQIIERILRRTKIVLIDNCRQCVVVRYI